MGSKQVLKEIKKIKRVCRSGRKLYNHLRDPNEDFSDFERAFRFFILNRISFSGLIESGGYSDESFKKRFTKSSIMRLEKICPLLKDVTITNHSYLDVLHKKGENVFIFLDPPYHCSMKSKLYGKNGDLHASFDHEKFALNMKKCKHKWLITYNDSPEIRKLFKFADMNICSWELQYGMNNYKQKSANKGKELFISNYIIPDLKGYEIK